MTDLIVGVGLHKTGTTSLGVALGELGFTVLGHRPELVPSLTRGEVAPALRLAQTADAVQDTPWPLLFAELDAAVPDARFVLTHRDPDAWLASVVKHFGGTTTPMREWIYGPGKGDPQAHPQVYLDRYRAHVARVREYFADRPHDLLELDMGRHPGWEPLCRFLDRPVPDRDFPHHNQAEPRWVRRVKRVYSRLRR